MAEGGFYGTNVFSVHGCRIDNKKRKVDKAVKGYGKELILDLHNCRPLPMTHIGLETYIDHLCSLIGMEQEDRHFWEYEDPKEYEKAPDHLKGTSVVQFIRTSNITIHTLDALGKVFINIFSCKDFDATAAEIFSVTYFGGRVRTTQVVNRL